MKKILLMGIAVSLVAFSANAWDASPYVSAKLMFADYGDFSKELYFQKIKFDTKANEIYLGLRYSF